MKFCEHCGKEIMDKAVLCPFCGCPVKKLETKASGRSTLKLVAFILCLLSAVGSALSAINDAFYLLALVWQIPMTVVVYRSYKTGKRLSLGFKICVLIFVNIIAGILLLCDKKEQ